MPPRLTLVVTPAARRDLDGIWAYNAATYGPNHADFYLAFLYREIGKLETDPLKGKPLPALTGVRFLTIRRGRGAGHIAIYEILGETVSLIRVQHTAQDWRGKAERGEL